MLPKRAELVQKLNSASTTKHDDVVEVPNPPPTPETDQQPDSGDNETNVQQQPQRDSYESDFLVLNVDNEMDEF